MWEKHEEMVREELSVKCAILFSFDYTRELKFCKYNVVNGMKLYGVFVTIENSNVI